MNINVGSIQTVFMKFSFLLIVALFLTSCGLFTSNENGTYIKSKTVINQFEQNLPREWTKIKSEGSDFAISNSGTSSVILFNSACRKFESSTLNALASSLLSGIEDIKIISRNRIKIAERDAEEIKASGKVDGVETYMAVSIVQKNFCIYDYVLISSSLSRLNNDYSVYLNLINGIKIN
jgi:hypothetical protein